MPKSFHELSSSIIKKKKFLNILIQNLTHELNPRHSQLN